MAALLLFVADSGLAAGDAENGQGLYAICAACHGQNAEGMVAMNSPALAGMEEWYVIRQLQNFKSGIRGSNPEDTYGLQMASMAKMLADEQAIADVAAYVYGLAN